MLQYVLFGVCWLLVLSLECLEILILHNSVGMSVELVERLVYQHL